jgi:hypothetical protein
MAQKIKQAKPMKPATKGDMVVWRERRGDTFAIGVVADCDPRGIVTTARVWCTGLSGPPGFRTFTVPTGCERVVGSAGDLNKPAEYVARAALYVNATTLDEVRNFAKQFRTEG